MMVYLKVGINKHFDHKIVNISLFIGLTILFWVFKGMVSLSRFFQVSTTYVLVKK